MGTYREIKGNVITLAIKGEFDVISHGVNCFCQMGAGIAPQMAKAFNANVFPMELPEHKGDMNKLGTIDCGTSYCKDGRVVRALPFEAFGNHRMVDPNQHELYVVNSYSQYGYGRNHTNGTDIPLDYEALTLCLRKINHKFKGKRIGLPQIGCGLAGGSWERVAYIIQNTLVDCDVTVVIYDGN